MSTLTSRLAGLTAGLALTIFMVGVPLLLLTMGAVPDLSAFARSRLTAPDDGTLAVDVITVICWIAWVVFTAQLLIAVVSRLRGIRSPRLPGLAVPQIAADHLVAVAALLFVAIPSATVTLPPPPADAAVTPPLLPALPHPTAEPPTLRQLTQQVPETTSAPDSEPYTVKRGDSLWKIAQERLGDGRRYVELVNLNSAALDGRPDFLLPGTLLRVPIVVAPPPPPDGYLVRPGDTLSEIAEKHLDEADAYPSIFEASRDIVQTDGAHLTDPDLILPGWRLTIPDDGPPERPPTRVQERMRPAETLPPVEAATPPSGDPTTPPEAQNGSQGGDDVEASPGWLLPGFAGAGAALAGCLWLVLRQHRRTQLRHRRPGTIIAPPPADLLPLQKSTHAVGSVTAPRIRDLDTALRSLSPAPHLLTASLSADRIALTLAEEAALPAPWSGSSTSWTLPLTDVPKPPHDSLAPYPLLVSVGQGPEGELVLVNLEELRTISLTGDADHGAALARHVIAELALNPWATLIHVDAVGIGSELAAINPGFIRIHDPEDTEFLHQLHRDLSTANPAVEPDEFHVAITAHTQHPSPQVEHLIHTINGFPTRPATVLISLDGRHASTQCDIAISAEGRLALPSLQLNLTAAGLTEEEASACALLIDLTREAEVAHVPPPIDDTAVSDASGALIDALTEPRPPGPAGTESLLPLAASVYADLAATTTHDVDELAPMAPTATADVVGAVDRTLDEDLACWESPVPLAPKLTLLGPVTARALGDTSTTRQRRPYYVELLAYLVLHPSGATADEVAEAFGIGPKKARTELSALRSWLGEDDDGSKYLPPARQTHESGVPATYAVHGVLCDLDLFRRLRARGQSRGADGMTDLAAALHLVSGEPFTELRPTGWSWLLEGERLDHVMTCAIVDVAHVVTAHALSVGDLDLADLATRVALAASPYDEVAQLDAVAVRGACGDETGADQQLRDNVLNRTDDQLGPIELPHRTTQIVRAHDGLTSRARRNAKP